MTKSGVAASQSDERDDIITSLIIRRRWSALGQLIDQSKNYASQQERVEAIRAAIAATPIERLRQINRAEREKEAAEAAAKAEVEDHKMFFHAPSAQADLSYWAKMPLWALEQAVALSFGKEPNLVKWGMLSPYIFISPFAQRYKKLRDLVLCAAQAGILSDPTRPAAFLAWAKDNEIEFPQAFEKLLEPSTPTPPAPSAPPATLLQLPSSSHQEPAWMAESRANTQRILDSMHTRGQEMHEALMAKLKVAENPPQAAAPAQPPTAEVGVMAQPSQAELVAHPDADLDPSAVIDPDDRGRSRKTKTKIQLVIDAAIDIIKEVDGNISEIDLVRSIQARHLPWPDDERYSAAAIKKIVRGEYDSQDKHGLVVDVWKAALSNPNGAKK